MAGTIKKKKILFVCVHNSARSQMAEAFLKQLAGDKFEVESAGLEPGELNPMVVVAMKEIGIDISRNKTKGIRDLYREGRRYEQVVTVCGGANADKCPMFPGAGPQVHWVFDDPSDFEGSYEEKLEKTREVRDAIRRKVEEWVALGDSFKHKNGDTLKV